MSKVKTIDLQGKEYAQVKDRLKQFRADCPNGSIKTEATYTSEGIAILKATIIADLSKPDSKNASGQAFGKVSGQKAFEKLETIAVGRALAFLGYAADGEIASSDEMEEFYAFKAEKREKAIAELRTATTLDELRNKFVALGAFGAEPDVMKVKNEMKIKLTK